MQVSLYVISSDTVDGGLLGPGGRATRLNEYTAYDVGGRSVKSQRSGVRRSENDSHRRVLERLRLLCSMFFRASAYVLAGVQLWCTQLAVFVFTVILGIGHTVAVKSVAHVKMNSISKVRALYIVVPFSNA